MKNVKQIIALVLLLGFFVVAQAQNQDEVAIQKVTKDFENTFNKKDAKATSSFWAEDGDFINYLGIHLHGRQEIEKYHQDIFVKYYKTAQNKLSDPSVRFLSSTIAAVDVPWEMTNATTADGKPRAVMKGIMVWTMTKENGHWYIKVMHNVTLP